MKLLSPVIINTAEAVIEPFWDPQLSGLSDWRIRRASRYGLSVFQQWSQVRFEWVTCPKQGAVLSMTLNRRIDCSDYDTLLLVVAPPPGTHVALEAETDRGSRCASRQAEPGNKMEVTMPLNGAREVRRITLSMTPATAGPGAGNLYWVGLRHARRLKDYRQRWETPMPVPERHLVPLRHVQAADPAYGIVMTVTELHRARRDPARIRHAETVRRRARRFSPETLINECLVLPGYMDNRYNRVWHHERPFAIEARELALAGLILKDTGLLRLAARMAMVKAMCPVWEENPLCVFPGGIWEHRAFMHTALMEDICAALDLAGAAFSDAGRDYLLRRIAEEGLGRTNFIAWKHEYIYHNNQLAAFSPGRIMAYAVLERHWPRVTPYLDQALRELNDNFNHILLPDGGYAEGPGYFAYGVGWGVRALEIAARARNLDLATIVPERLKLSANMAVCLGSTDDACTFIPFGDAHPQMDAATCERFAAFTPEGGWHWLARRARAREAGRPLPAIEWPPFIRLPAMGTLASHRRLDGHWVKLFVSGCVRDADHNHEDKGGFVLEVAGDTLALDPGKTRYAGSAAAALLKTVEFHNMLVPYGRFSQRPHPELPHPEAPWPEGIVADGRGDAQTLQVKVDATRGYERYFRKWVRRFTSTHPGELTIRDDYQLEQGDGVDFLWQTHQAVQRDGERTVIVRGHRSQAILQAPPGCRISVEEAAREQPSSDQPETVHRRIRIRKPGRRGRLTIRIRLEIF